MLKTISHDKIFSKSNEIKSTKICGSFRASNNSIDDQAIEDIIIHNINIQIALVPPLYPYPSNENGEDYNSYVHIIGFLKNQNRYIQIENLKQIFSKIIFLKINDDIDLCQVASPFENVRNVFNDLLKQNRLNKWVMYFMLKPRVDDCTQMVYYQYFLNDQNEKMPLIVEEIKNDCFFNYVLKNERNLIQLKGFPISGFTLNQINSDIYIKALSMIVEHLYLVIIQDTVEEQIYYSKHLTWGDTL